MIREVLANKADVSNTVLRSPRPASEARGEG